MTRLTIVLSVLGLGLVLLIVNHDSGRTFGFINDDFARMVGLGALAALIGVGILRSRRNWGNSLRQIGLWLLILLAIVALYLYRTELAAFGERLIGGLMPGRATVVTDQAGRTEVVIRKRIGGHFETGVSVNGRTVDMMIDTGASAVALAYDDATNIGLDPTALTFSQTIRTANGDARAAPVTLAEVSIGPIPRRPILRRNVRAVVAEKDKLDQSLLGMSFLETLDSVQMRADEMRLRD